MAGEGPVVGLHPRRLVAPSDEGTCLERSSSGEDVGGEWEDHAHLEHVPLHLEAQPSCPSVVGGTGLHDPQVDLGSRWRQRQGALHECAGERAAAVGSPRRRVEDNVEGPGGAAGLRQHGEAHQHTPAAGERDVTPDVVGSFRRAHGEALRIGQGRVAVGCVDARQQLAHRRPVVRAERFQGDHHHFIGHGVNVTRYREPVAKPRTPQGRARLTRQRLAERYPGRAADLCALDFADPFQLLAATILSAQSTDVRVNLVTPELFAHYPDAASLAAADPEAVEALVRSTGFFRSKTKSLIGMATAVAERFGGEVPTALEDLVTIPGVGRKTANVVRSVAFSLPGLPVDTHVLRLSQRLGLTERLPTEARRDAVKVELELNKLVPANERGVFSLRLILHGRNTCLARMPRCGDCLLADFCPSVRSPTSRPRPHAMSPSADPAT